MSPGAEIRISESCERTLAWIDPRTLTMSFRTDSSVRNLMFGLRKVKSRFLTAEAVSE